MHKGGSLGKPEPRGGCAATGTMPDVRSSNAPSTLLGRAQEAIVHAVAATSAAGTVVVNKVAAYQQ